MFVGIGYDVHKFAAQRKLVLGGVSIKYKAGLDGHSDADVLVHAIMDAILGACGKRDIGFHFPNNDKKLKNISSITLLSRVGKLISKDNFTIANIDATIIAQEPKVLRFIKKMKHNIAKVLGINKERIGIKATTNEGMGFIGRKEGIAAMAVALVKKNDTALQHAQR